MDAQNTSLLSSATNTICTFVALYFTTLFSLDTWDAARGSPFRAPGPNTYFRPAATPPSSDSYQGRMGRLSGGGAGGSGERGVGRLPTVRDSRPPLKMGGTAACGACAM